MTTWITPEYVLMAPSRLSTQWQTYNTTLRVSLATNYTCSRYRTICIKNYIVTQRQDVMLIESRGIQQMPSDRHS